MIIRTLRFSPLFIISFCFIFSFITSPLHAQTVPESDSLALVALYNSTNGDNWTRNDNWLTGPVSTWYGITVIDGTVNRIELENNNLTGSLPEAIGNFSGLNVLSLTSNQIGGTIPSSIGNLSDLRNLSFFSNQLSGEIPGTIGNLTGLYSIFLSRNQLTGNIPETLGNLSKIITLDLSDNQLSGKIPDEIWGLSTLNKLALSRNQLSSTLSSSIKKLENLTSLIINSNQFIGSIPTEIGEMEKLETLDLSENNFSGELPSSIGNLKNLQNLSLSDCKFYGKVPDTINNLTKLWQLNLGNNNFTALPKLSINYIYSLVINFNQFTFEDVIPNLRLFRYRSDYYPQKEIGEQDTIQLEVGDTYVLKFDIDPTVVGNQFIWQKNGFAIDTTEVNQLILKDIDFSDYGVYSCKVINPEVPDFSLFQSPTSIKISFPGGRTVPESDSLALVALYNSTNGNEWTRNDNWLEGPVSSWYGVTVVNGRVETIFLENNNLKGNIPASIGDLTNLTDIALYDNELEGPIPEQIGNLTKLRSINFYQNNLSGNIPESIGNLVNLNTLWIRGNNLEGSIPSEIGNLHNLE